MVISATHQPGGTGNCDNLLQMRRAGDGSDKPLKISSNGDDRDVEREAPNHGENRILNRTKSESGVQILTSSDVYGSPV